MKKTQLMTRKDRSGYYIKAIRGGYFSVVSRYSQDYVLCGSKEEAEQVMSEQIELEKQIIANMK